MSFRHTDIDMLLVTGGSRMPRMRLLVGRPVATRSPPRAQVDHHDKPQSQRVGGGSRCCALAFQTLEPFREMQTV